MGELGARFQCAGGDDDRRLFLRGAEHASHQSKGDQSQGADDDRRSRFLHDVPPPCTAAHGVLFRQECAQALAGEFISEPSMEPFLDCLDALQDIKFIVP